MAIEMRTGRFLVFLGARVSERDEGGGGGERQILLKRRKMAVLIKRRRKKAVLLASTCRQFFGCEIKARKGGF